MAIASDSPRYVGRLFFNLFLLSIPFLIIIGSYVILDPFLVLYHYKTFTEPLIAIPNRDYVSTQMYLNTYQQRNYKSFILGNSRTMSFLVKDWAHYTGDNYAFHYDASGESLYGVWQKLLFIEQHNPSIKNVLIVCDSDLLKQISDSESHIGRKDPRTTGDLPFNFQLSFLKAYFSDHFYYKYIRRKITNEVTPDMAEVMETSRVYYDPVTNDLSLPDIDEEIRRDSTGFYANNKRLQIVRKPGISKAVIGASQLQQLVAIRNIFKRHNTNYQIVISPLYNQKQLNPADLSILQRTFGATTIHDFSGTNEFTKYPGNYYEESHYRPLVGRKILKQIYGDHTTK